MSYKSDLPFQMQEPPKQSFVSYLKQQHQQSLQTTQNLQNRIQILQKSIQHLQARIKLKDTQIHQKNQQLANKDAELEQLRNSNAALLMKNKTLKKQNAKIQMQNKQLQQLLENQRAILQSWENSRDYDVQRERAREIEESREWEREIQRQREKQRIKQLEKGGDKNNTQLQRQVNHLMRKNLELEKNIGRLQEQAENQNNLNKRENVQKKQLEIEQLHSILNKMHQEIQSKNLLFEQLQLQNNLLFKQNALMKEQIHRSVQHHDHSSWRKSTKVSLPTPTPHQKFNTISSNRNNSVEVNGKPRRVGAIKNKNSDDSIDQSDTSSECRLVEQKIPVNNSKSLRKYDNNNDVKKQFFRREQQKNKLFVKHNKGPVDQQKMEMGKAIRIQQENQRKQHFLEALVARFEKLKSNSLANTTVL